MLPDGIIPIPKLQREKNLGNKIINLGALLGYLLKLLNPNQEPQNGKKLMLGERVDANKHLFADFTDVFFAIKVRNCFTHPEDCDRVWSEAEKARAANHLFRAVKQLCDHPAMPPQIRFEILRDASQDQQRPSPVQYTPPPKIESSISRTTYQPSAPAFVPAPASTSYSYPRSRAASRPRRRFLGKFIFLIIVIAIIYIAITKVSPFLTAVGSFFSSPPHTETAYVNTQQVNLRDGPGSEYKVIAKLSRGDSVACVEVRQSSDGANWVRVRVSSYEGWLNQKLLSREASAQQNQSNSTPPTAQTDTVSPQANVKPTPMNPSVIPEPSYDIPMLKATVTSVRFFESGYDAPPYGQRNYRTSFTRADSRYINWEIDFSHPAPGRRIEFRVEVNYYRSDGSLLGSPSVSRYVDPNWTTSYHNYSWGWAQAGNWSPGAYKAEFSIDGKRIATGRFDIYDAPIQSPRETATYPQRRTEESPRPPSQQSRRDENKGVIIKGIEDIVNKIRRHKKN